MPQLSRLYVLFCLILVPFTVTGQHDPYEVFFNGVGSNNVEAGLPANFDELFLEPLSGGSSLFGELTGYGFGPVRYSRRSVRNELRSVSLFGADISGNLNSAADYGLWSAIGRSGLLELRENYASDSKNTSDISQRRFYVLDNETVRDRTRFGMFVTDRKGLFGAKASTSGRIGESWIYMADIYRRWGNDASIKGVFADRLAYSTGVSKKWKEKHSLTVFSAGEYGTNGLRSYITAEAVELSGDVYYNPSWGYQGGKQRNSRVATGLVPIIVLAYSGELTDKLSMAMTLSYRGGEQAVSGLSWLDAATPYPDYYRYMPSYASSNMAAESIIGRWAAGDRSVTNIDWANLYKVNSLNNSTAVYTVSDRVEKIRDYQGMSRMGLKVDKFTNAGASVHIRSENVRRFRRMKDLMGGASIKDIDQYLYEDEIYGNSSLNNVREPYRKVNEGDVFGYDYDIFAREVGISLWAEYHKKGLLVRGNAGLDYVSYFRNGRFEKELYPAGLSYGNSDKIKYELFSAEVHMRYAFSPMHNIMANVAGGRSAQLWGTHFISPMYSNVTTGNGQPLSRVHAEAGYEFRNRTLRASAAVYITPVTGRNELYNYWDDIATTYSAMIVTGIRELTQGVELAADYELHPRWNVAAAASVTSSKYNSDPQVDIYSENTLQKYVSGARTYLKGYRTGFSPESVVTGKVSYNGKGFSGTLALNHAGGRYVTPAPLLRMQRAYNLALSDEVRAKYLDQQRLGSAFTVDVSFLKSFRIKDAYLSFFFSVSNLLDDKGIIYGAYEQMRIARQGSGANVNMVPFGNKYLYAHGRTFYFSATWSF